MIRYIQIEASPVYIVGDLHNKVALFIDKVKELDLRNCSIFFVGDMSFADKETAVSCFSSLDKELFEREISSYIIRGDLDNPYLWNDSNFWENFQSFKPVNSSTRLKINGNIGIIIDSASTLLDNKTKTWQDYNKPSLPFDYVDLGESLKNVDFVIGHGGPVLSDFFKFQKGYEAYLKEGILHPDLAEEQKIYRQLLHRYRPRRWYCGHYHISKHTKYVWDNWSNDGVIDIKIINEGEILQIA